ncbi:MAG TPA: hypothetical protein VGJ38_12730 [Jatrophihabitantaceae bacterium]
MLSTALSDDLFGVLTRLGHTRRNIAQLDMSALRDDDEPLEGIVRAEAMPLHEDPDCLADNLPAADGPTQVVHLVGVSDCDRGAARKDGSDELAGGAERTSSARIEAEHSYRSSDRW